MTKILIVEDDPLILRMYKKIFSFEKYEVDVASNGQEGFDKAKSGKPNLVLLDIMMPKMNGLEMLQKLKADPVTKKIPVVILTNLSDKKDAETALKMGAVKYIVKSEQDAESVTKMVKGILI